MPDATERKALYLSAFAAGCICLGPMEWTSAGVLLVLSLILFLLHRRITKREVAFLRLLDAWALPAGAEPGKLDAGISEAPPAASGSPP